MFEKHTLAFAVPAVLVLVWSAAVSVPAAGVSPLAAGAPDGGHEPVGLLFMEGHDTPTKLMFTKYWSGSRVALRLLPSATASMTAGIGLPLPNFCKTDCASRPA